jgi:molecular chaperone GrpE (heat shock protein)
MATKTNLLIGDASMKIHIDIDLQPHDTAELARLVQFAKNIFASIDTMEAEIENYRQRLERVEEMTTRFESKREEN